MQPNFEIDPIVLKYVRGVVLSAEESARLRQWMDEADGREALIRRLRDDPAYIQSELRRLRQVNTESIWAKVEDRITAPTPIVRDSRRTRKIWPWIAAACLIFLAGAGGAWLWYSTQRHALATPVAAAPATVSDVKPGGNKAILTLSGGRRIDLSTTANGVLASESNSTIAKVSEGQLAYDREKSGERPVAPAFNSLSTPRAGQFTLRLPDGTRVWLNNASVLRYPASFTGTDRTVELAGEAYFEIAKDAGHPFRVLVHRSATAGATLNNMSSYAPPVADDGGVIEVLGTSFNVMAYADEPSERTTLVTGSLRVSGASQTAILRPAEQSTLDARGKLHVIPDVNVQQVIAWKNGYFNFEHATLETAMRQLARWYDIEVIYQGEVPSKQDFEGRIQRTLPLSDILKGLENEHVHFKLDGRKLTVTP